MEFTVRKLTPSVGAEINGLDLSRPLDPDTIGRVRKVWLDKRAALRWGTPFDGARHKRRPHRTTVAGTGPIPQGRRMPGDACVAPTNPGGRATGLCSSVMA